MHDMTSQQVAEIVNPWSAERDGDAPDDASLGELVTQLAIGESAPEAPQGPYHTYTFSFQVPLQVIIYGWADTMTPARAVLEARKQVAALATSIVGKKVSINSSHDGFEPLDATICQPGEPRFPDNPVADNYSIRYSTTELEALAETGRVPSRSGFAESEL